MTGKIGKKSKLVQSYFLLLKVLLSYIHQVISWEFLSNLMETILTLKSEKCGNASSRNETDPVTEADVDASVVEKELEIAKEQLINEGKPEEIAEKAAKVNFIGSMKSEFF